MNTLVSVVFVVNNSLIKLTLLNLPRLIFSPYFTGEVFDYLVAHGRMKEKEARIKFRQVSKTVHSRTYCEVMLDYLYDELGCIHSQDRSTDGGGGADSSPNPSPLTAIRYQTLAAYRQ